MQKIKKTYRLSENIVEKLEELAKRNGTTATAILEDAVRTYDDGEPYEEPHEADSEPYTVVIEILREQLEEKDRQLERAHINLQTAMALHASENNGIARRFQRLLAKAWNG